jgi:hypothetical protein
MEPEWIVLSVIAGGHCFMLVCAIVSYRRETYRTPK